MLALLLSLAFCIQKQKPRRPQIVSKNTYSNKKHTNIPDNADSCEMCTEVVDYIEYLIDRGCSFSISSLSNTSIPCIHRMQLYC